MAGQQQRVTDPAPGLRVITNKSTDRKIPWSFCPLDRQFMRELGNPRYGLPSLSYCVVMHVMSHQWLEWPEDETMPPHFKPAHLSISKLAKDISDQIGKAFDRRNVRRVVQRLEAQKVLIRNGDAVEVNFKTDQWLSESEVKEAIKMLEDGVTDNPGSHVTQGGGSSVTHEDGLHVTPHDSPEASSEADHNRPLDHEIMTTHDPRPSVEAQTHEDSPFKTLEDLVSEAASLLEVGGYALAKKSIDRRGEFKRLMRLQATKGNVDGRGFRRTPEEYLADFIIPTIQDCPEKFRVDYQDWTEEFRFALSASRDADTYLNRWRDRRPSVTVAQAAKAEELVAGDSAFGD